MNITLHSRESSFRTQRGMGLIEIMVGVLIGMIGILAVFSVLHLAEERRRSITTGSDAQGSAAVALFRIEREVSQAGFGFGDARDFYNCPTRINRTGRAGGAVFTTPLLPVSITDGVGGAPDVLTIWYGNSMLATSRQSFSIGSATSKTPEQGTAGFNTAPADVVLVTAASTPPAPCALGSSAVVQVSSKTITAIQHTGGGQYANPAGIPNPGFLYNLGPTPTINRWSIGVIGNTVGLVSQDFLNNGVTNTMAAENVVDLQAQYGVDTALTGADPVIVWTNDPSGVAGGYKKVVAIRIAVLVQSNNYEKDAIDAPTPSWTVGASVGGGGTSSQDFVLPTMADGTDPTHYRYKVYETIMPLRNVVWGYVE